MQYKISVIIRTYNEEKHLKEVLDSLNRQTYKNFEIIIVDSESTDNTLNIVKNYQCKLVKIKKSDFNYSYASNVGAENSSGELLCFLSGHSVPVKSNYLELINQTFQEESTAGCYGEVKALKDGSVIEKLFNNLGYIKSKRKGIEVEQDIHPGILSCSNACIRKSVWVEHNFVDELGKGGEDVEMAHYILSKNLNVIKNPEILAYHSHGSNLFKFMKELKNWKKLYADVLNYISSTRKD